MAHSAGSDGQREHAGSGRGGDQCRRAWRPRHVGPQRRAGRTTHRRVPSAMRQHLQAQYDAHGLGRVPEPAGSVSDVGPEHVALLLDTKPEMVSFHFGLPEPELIRALKSAGIFILSSATTVAEARLLEQRRVDAIIAQGTEAGGHRATFTGV